MKLIAKRSVDPIIGLSLGFTILLVSILCVVLSDNSSVGTVLIVPELVGVITILIFGFQLSTPYELIHYNEEKKTLIIHVRKNDDKEISLVELTNLYQDSSGIRRNYTGSLTFVAGENVVHVSNVADALNVALEIEKLKKEADEYVDNSLNFFEKL